MKFRHSVLLLLSVSIGTLLLTGCPPKKKLAIEERASEDVVDADADKAMSPNDIEITQDWAEVPALAVVRFDYDSAKLNEAQRTVLKQNVTVLKKFPKSVTVRVEGHCDDRGTVEYNIALGQRRADAVRSFYATSGLGAARVKSISFGEERPACRVESDDCWAQNRRAVTTVRNDSPLTIKADQLK